MHTQDLEAHLDENIHRYAPLVRRVFTVLTWLFLGLFFSLGGIFLQQKNQLSQTNLEQVQSLTQQSKLFLNLELKALLSNIPADSPAFLHRLREAVFKLNLGDAGYLVIFDHQGKLVHHPNLEQALTGQQVETAELPSLKSQIETLLQERKSSFQIYTDRQNPLWVFMEPLENPNYFMGVIFFERDLNTQSFQVMQQPFLCSLALGV